MGGRLVTRWQQLLRDKGFVLDVDGIFGPKTLSATKAAQAWAAVTIDGVVGPITWNAVERKTRTRRPITVIRNTILATPRIVDARNGKAGFPHHPYKTWRSRSHVEAVVGHYTGGPASFVADANFHVKSSYLDAGGAPALAYHLGVDKDGTLFVFNDWQSITWHARSANTKGLGVVFRGGSEGPTAAQAKTLRWLLRQIAAGTFQPVKAEPRWPKIAVTTTHRHITATSCPGERGEVFYRANPAGRFVTTL